MSEQYTLEQIDAEIARRKQQEAVKPKEETGLSGIAKDFYESLLKIPGALGEMARGVPGQLENLGEQIHRSPGGFRNPFAGRLNQNLGAAAIDTGVGIPNIPGNIRDYLGRKEVIPEGTPSMRIPGFPQQVDSNQIMGLGEPQPADALIQGLAGNLPFGALGEVGKLGTLGRMGARSGAQFGYGLSQGENPVVSAGMVALPEAVYRGGKAGYQGAKAGIEQTGRKFQEAKEGYQLTKEEKALEQKALALEKQLMDTKEGLKGKQAEAAQEYGNISESLGANEQAGIKEISQFAPRQEAKTIGTLVDRLRDAYRGKEGFKTKIGQKYEDFANSNAAKVKITNGMDLPTFEATLDIPLESLSPVMRQQIAKNIGIREEVPGYFDYAQGNVEGKTVYKKAEPTVKDQMTFRKQINKEAFNMFEKADDPKLGSAEKEKLVTDGEKLLEFGNAIDRQIEAALPEAKRAEYQGIQNEWRTLVIPFKRTALLRGVVKGGNGTVKVDDFFSALTKENVPELREALMSNPKTQEAIVKHKLMNTDVGAKGAAAELLEGDFGRALPPNVKRSLEKINYNQDTKNYVDALRKQIGSSELNRMIRAPETRAIFERHPELAQPLESIEAMQKAYSTFERELKQTNLSKKQIQERLEDYRKLSRLLLSGAATVFGGKTIGAAKGAKEFMRK